VVSSRTESPISEAAIPMSRVGKVLRVASN
jgi:hypothetical protein